MAPPITLDIYVKINIRLEKCSLKLTKALLKKSMIFIEL
ncbi:hypothetical protein SAMN05421832_11927 [Psychrobacillus psychrodurans]|nr:hypothetical protein SAMN05421832_11927 [Psychrobacillus psychrodurans]